MLHIVAIIVRTSIQYYAYYAYYAYSVNPAIWHIMHIVHNIAYSSYAYAATSRRRDELELQGPHLEPWQRSISSVGPSISAYYDIEIETFDIERY